MTAPAIADSGGDEEFGIEHGSDWMRGAAREGLEHFVRAAMLRSGPSAANHDASDDLGGWEVPKFVTFHSDDAGWVRVPRSAATLHQLQSMAECRRRQSVELAEAAEEIEAVVREFEGRAAMAGLGRKALLSEILEASIGHLPPEAAAS